MSFRCLHLIAVLVLSPVLAQPTDSDAINGLNLRTSGKQEIVLQRTSIPVTQVSKEHSDLLKSPLTHEPEISLSSEIGYAMWRDQRLGVGLPHITRFPDPGVMLKVNEELGRELQKRREAVVECMDEHDSPGWSWEEEVSVSLFSTDVLSVVRRSDYYCGGNHPNTALEPLVYDLHTGTTTASV